MRKLCITFLSIAFLTSCANQTTNEAVPSSEDTAVFNQHVESWKTAISGFSSEDPVKVMSIFADSLKWNNPEPLMNVKDRKSVV